MARCVWLGVIFLSVAARSRAFEIIETSPDQSTSAGSSSPLRLACKSDSYFEFCVWRHNSDICEFEWKQKHDAVKKQRCSAEFNGRMKFSGNYEKHECVIELEGVRLEDAGEWSCEMEDYVWGPARGVVHKKVLQVAVSQPVQNEYPEEVKDDFEETFVEFAENDKELENDIVEDFGSLNEISFSPRNVIFPEDEGEPDKTLTTEEDIKFDHDHDEESGVSDEAVNSTSSSNPESEPVFTGEDDADDEAGAVLPLIGLTLGILGALFVILVLGFVYYRRSKKHTLEADWKAQQEQKMMQEENRLELNKIIEESEQNPPNSLPNGGRAVLETISEKEELEKRFTYQGSRHYSFDENSSQK